MISRSMMAGGRRSSQPRFPPPQAVVILARQVRLHVRLDKVSRISTDIKTGGTCYTDSNGREMLQRKRALPRIIIMYWESVAAAAAPRRLPANLEIEANRGGCRLPF